MASRDTNTGAKRARELREKLGLGPTQPVDCILTAVESDLGIPVVVADLGRELAGVCWRDGERTVLWVNGTQWVPRQRFTLAHELGHVRCGHDGRMPAETFATLGGRDTDRREVQANAFAAELLAPRDGVLAAVGDDEPGIDAVVLIAATYGISMPAALYRLGNLGIDHDRDALQTAIKAREDDGLWQRIADQLPVDGLEEVRRGRLPRCSPSLDGTSLPGELRLSPLGRPGTDDPDRPQAPPVPA